MDQPASRPLPVFDYSQPPGAAALLDPGSVAWRVYKNQVALAIGGVAAVLMEFADPRIRSGVWDHSIYRFDPIGRSQRTGHAAMIGVYGPAAAARQVIAGVGRMLDWVSATAGYGFLTAYHRFVAPLSAAEQSRFYREGGPVAELYGVQNKLTCRADFTAMMERLSPGFEPHPINEEFLGIIQSGKAAPTVPRFLHRAMARAAVSILPAPIRDRLQLGAEYDLGLRDRIAVRLVAGLAERKHDPATPPAQASVRLGLPSDFLWRAPLEQARLLESSRQAA
jgi:uncharacterized protein (DUF2236 family)